MSRLFVARLASILVLFAGAAPPAKKVPPPKLEDLATIWVGLTEDELYLLRLELSSDGGGRLAYAFMDSEPRTFPIKSWTLKDTTISFSVGPGSTGAGTVTRANGHASATALSILLEGADWKRRAEFRRERTLEERWKTVRRAMAQDAVR